MIPQYNPVNFQYIHIVIRFVQVYKKLTENVVRADKGDVFYQ